MKFTDEQRSYLLNLGLMPTQIDGVEDELPLIRVLVESPARRDDVRDELVELLKPVDGACTLADKLTNPKKHAADKICSRTEAWSRLQCAASDASSVETLSESVAALKTLRSIIEIALARLPKKQRRSVAANFKPVAQIAEALSDGFVRAYESDSAMPPYTLRVSSSPNSKFRKIVGICYEAAGLKNSDPVRAINKYISWIKRSTQAQREAMGINVLQTSKSDSSKKEKRK